MSAGNFRKQREKGGEEREKEKRPMPSNESRRCEGDRHQFSSSFVYF
jgi:hypothetical protein